MDLSVSEFSHIYGIVCSTRESSIISLIVIYKLSDAIIASFKYFCYVIYFRNCRKMYFTYTDSRILRIIIDIKYL